MGTEPVQHFCRPTCCNFVIKIRRCNRVARLSHPSGYASVRRSDWPISQHNTTPRALYTVVCLDRIIPMYSGACALNCQFSWLSTNTRYNTSLQRRFVRIDILCIWLFWAVPAWSKPENDEFPNCSPMPTSPAQPSQAVEFINILWAA